MLSESQQRIVGELEDGHPRWNVWVVNTATGGPIWCARMKDDYGPGMRTLTNTGSYAHLDQRMTEVEHAPEPYRPD
jgi:hypothetical protein